MDSAERLEYTAAGLVETDLPAAPFAAIGRWLDDATARQGSHGDLAEPHMITVATAGAGGAPSLRPVLMRVFDERGVGFFSQLGSRKARDLADNDQVAASFVWPQLFRCLHLRGRARPLDEPTVEAYWRQRPWGAQISAMVSDQSQPVADRQTLLERVARVSAAHPEGGDPVPRPRSFVGWLIEPDEVEFWAGQPNRLHDRIVYTRTGPGTLADPVWAMTRVQP